ncbi:hypothetical protein AX14_013686 [Amanita brunnescens Koide BX004]|nr:hypothetical protein AX14_013686 [Amanita brunnescens Koide BX004]
MARSDVFALFITIAIVGAVIFVALYVTRGIHNTLQTTKEKLKSRGYDVSSSGISVKTDKRFDHEAYLDATQRGLIRALGASSTGQGSKPVLDRFSLAHHGNQSSTTHGVESLERDGEPGKRHRLHFWRGKHSEKDAL